MKLKRIIAVLLLLAMIFSVFQFNTFAMHVDGEDVIEASIESDNVATETTDDNLISDTKLEEDAIGFFYFSAESKRKLLIAPTRVSYTYGQTYFDALRAAGFSFEEVDGMITKIQNTTGNFSYATAPNNKNLFDEPADESYFCFNENKSEAIGTGWQQLMREMAEYQREDPDVQLAVRALYIEACDAYCSANESTALSYSEKIHDAIENYKSSLVKRYQVVFEDFQGTGYRISAKNEYGKTFNTDNGILHLPDGSYTYDVQKDSRLLSGKLNVSGADQRISGLSIPDIDWFDETKFQISSINENDGRFENGVYNVTTDAESNGNAGHVVIPDTFMGKLYPYVVLTESAPDNAVVTALYTDTAGITICKEIPAEKKVYHIADTLCRGAKGNAVVFRVSASVDGTDDYTLSQDYTLQLDRMPTLSSLRVLNSKGTAQAADQAFSRTVLNYTYRILNTEQKMYIYPEATMTSDYEITINETLLTADMSNVCVSVSENPVQITVTGGDYSTVYQLVFTQGKASKVTITPVCADGITVDHDVSITVLNKDGEPIDSRIDLDGSYVYTLVQDQTYTYIATKDSFFHAKKTFTLTEKTSFDVNVKGDELFADQPIVKELALGSNVAAKFKGNIFGDEKNEKFDAKKHEYTVNISDAVSSFAVWENHEKSINLSIGENLVPCSITSLLSYQVLSAGSDCWTYKRVDNIENGANRGYSINDAIMQGNTHGNTLLFQIFVPVSATLSGSEEAGVIYYTDYKINLKRTLSLENIVVSCGGYNVPLNDGAGFEKAVKNYDIYISAAAAYLDITLDTIKSSPQYGEADNGYIVDVDGKTVPESGQCRIVLNGNQNTETITITVKSKYEEISPTSYYLNVHKNPSVTVQFDLEPSEPKSPLLFLYEKDSRNRVIPDENENYMLSQGFIYCYSLTLKGYQGKVGAFQLKENSQGQMMLDFGRLEKDSNGNEAFVSDQQPVDTLNPVPLSLLPAPVNEMLDTKIDAEWADFRGTAYQGGVTGGTEHTNNGITDTRIPIDAENGTLYWTAGIGVGYGSGAVSCPILVDGNLIVYAGTQIMKIDKDTGKIIGEPKQMAATSSFAVNNPTYAEGVVLVGLSDGRIQAFDAKTLDSLWIYTDPLGGQPNCPITVYDGYVYTGFWYSEDAEASFVCLSLTDEDPSDPLEAKAATWRYIQKGGFYWAGSYVCDDYVLVGTDDGYTGYTHETARLLLLDAKTGILLDSIGDFRGDIRSSICFDKTTNTSYFTSKGGFFYGVQVVKDENQKWKLGEKSEVELNGMSTSTPVVYKNRAYIGVCGKKQFSAYGGHSIAVIDLKKMEVSYSVETQGYPQTSGLLTTGYENNNGYIYVFFFDNFTPGKLRVLRESAEQIGDTKYYTVEADQTETKKQTAYALFTPVSPEAQYAICSPIVDENGTLYFKNDSGYLMAYGSAVKSLEIEKKPKTEYTEGEKFDASGLKVTATYENGTTRDVTRLMLTDDKALTVKDEKVTLVYCKDQKMYHNQQNTADNTMTPGVKTTTKSVDLPITVTSATVEREIDNLKWSFTAQSGELSVSGDFNGRTLIAACYDANGQMIQVKTLTATGEMPLSRSKDSARIKLFLLDSTNKPVCPAVTVKEPTK